MAWNDPLRRYELAQRLQRLREQGAAPGGTSGSEASDRPGPEVLSDDDRVRALVSRVMAEMTAEAAAVPAAGPAVPHWQDEWWSADTGPTPAASRVFRGPDGWVLAWVLHRRTGLPLAAVEEREPGSRLRFWVRRQIVVDILDGRYLDVDGPVARDPAIARYTSPRSASRRLLSLPDPPRWRDLDVPGGRDATWRDVLVDTRPEVVELVAAELAARHGLGAGA
jgi:hypothetical protein